MAALMPILVAGLATLGGYTYFDTAKRAITLAGIGREVVNTPVLHGGDFVLIEDTAHCEDMHHHVASELLFTACEDDETTRGMWFPGLGHLDDPVKGSKQKGSIHVIDPKDMSQKRLKFENFDGTFCTHGLDVISDPQRPEAVYIFAINHVPHPEYLATKAQVGGQSKQKVVQKSLSRVEIFHHILMSSTVKHLRTVVDPLIKNPNDLLAKDPYSFYVTNDHHNSEGIGRMVEDMLPFTSWTTTVHVRVEEMSVLAPTNGIKAEVALSGLRNNNGLGHGRNPDDIIVSNCAAGEISLAQLSSDPENTSITFTETIAVDSYVDNPSWFEDPYRSEDHDASGFVLAGLPRPVDVLRLARAAKPRIASVVWHVKPTASGGYEKRILFQDDGSRVSSAATAVLVAIDPSQEKGQKKAWLFITGFLSSNAVAIKVDL
ncbi:serum paraoxonase/arylesterase [Colletotrichum falcatum]|nr:serum paraoxonase/arylesterase [Colletotrichum falcatum]